MKFLCSECGACCRDVQDIGLPHDNGICLNLDRKTNKCLIYKNRPDICKVNKMFEKHFKLKMTKKEFFIKNTKACHELIDRFKINEKYKINIKEYEKL